MRRSRARAAGGRFPPCPPGLAWTAGPPPLLTAIGHPPPAPEPMRTQSETCGTVRDRDGRAPCFAEVEEEGRPFRPGPGDMEQSRVPCRPDPVKHAIGRDPRPANIARFRVAWRLPWT